MRCTIFSGGSMFPGMGGLWLAFGMVSGGLLAETGNEGWESIFDGKTLNGWEAPAMSYWGVEDGAITATSSDENPCSQNQFLVWSGGEIANFELRLQFRLEGGPRANSGIQVRSRLQEDGHAVGYQADISPLEGRWLGAIYDEHGRKALATRGQRTVIDGTGEMTKVTEEDPVSAVAGLNLLEWTDYRVRFVDEVMEVWIGGKLMSRVEDHQESEREMSGILALQLHSGPPMKVQFRRIELKRLPGEAS